MQTTSNDVEIVSSENETLADAQQPTKKRVSFTVYFVNYFTICELLNSRGLIQFPNNVLQDVFVRRNTFAIDQNNKYRLFKQDLVHTFFRWL